MRTGPYAHQLP